MSTTATSAPAAPSAASFSAFRPSARTGIFAANSLPTITLMKMAADFLANRIGYDVPRQDLRIDMRRLPALPADGFVIANVHAL